MSQNYKIEKLSYEEYLQYSDLYINILKEDIFNSYQSKDKAPVKYYKIRVGLQFVYFEITNSKLKFINDNIYDNDCTTVLNIFKAIHALGINQNICFYTPTFYGVNDSINDYVDNLDIKERFISKYESFFCKQEYENVYIVSVNGNDNKDFDLDIKEENNRFIFTNKDNTFRLVCYRIKDNAVFIPKIPFNRLKEENKEDNYLKNLKAAVEFLESKSFKVFTYTDLNFDEDEYKDYLTYKFYKKIYMYYL